MLGGEYKKLFDFIVEIQTGCLSCEDINDGAVMPSACVFVYKYRSDGHIKTRNYEEERHNVRLTWLLL